MNVLIIEDEVDLSKNLYKYLSDSNFYCETALDYYSASLKIKERDYDCILIDISLPGGNGLDIIKQVKNRNRQDGILVISAKNSPDERIKGLELGADDFLSKPFHMGELNARINAIIRRRQFEGNNLISLSSLTLDLLNKSAISPKMEIEFTRKEYDLLLYFISNKNRVVSKEAIIEHLWNGGSSMSTSYDILYSHIKNIKKKLIDAECSEYIKSEYGLGYRFVVPDAKS